MYSVDNGSSAATVPAFLTKLWALVEDPSTNDLICWDPVSDNIRDSEISLTHCNVSIKVSLP